MRKEMLFLLLILVSSMFCRYYSIVDNNYITDIDSIYLGDTLTADTVYTLDLGSGGSGLPYGISPDFVYTIITIQDSANTGGYTPTNTCTLRVEGLFVDNADSVWESIVQYTNSNANGTVYRYFETVPMRKLRFWWSSNSGIIRIGYSLLKQE